jgi:hypothetical protein
MMYHLPSINEVVIATLYLLSTDRLRIINAHVRSVVFFLRPWSLEGSLRDFIFEQVGEVRL